MPRTTRRTHNQSFGDGEEEMTSTPQKRARVDQPNVVESLQIQSPGRSPPILEQQSPVRENTSTSPDQMTMMMQLMQVLQDQQREERQEREKLREQERLERERERAERELERVQERREREEFLKKMENLQVPEPSAHIPAVVSSPRVPIRSDPVPVSVPLMVENQVSQEPERSVTILGSGQPQVACSAFNSGTIVAPSALTATQTRFNRIENNSQIDGNCRERIMFGNDDYLRSQMLPGTSHYPLGQTLVDARNLQENPRRVGDAVPTGSTHKTVHNFQGCDLGSRIVSGNQSSSLGVQSTVNVENRGWGMHLAPGSFTNSTNAQMATNFMTDERQMNVSLNNQVPMHSVNQINSSRFGGNESSMLPSSVFPHTVRNNNVQFSNPQCQSRTSFVPLKSGTFDGSTSWTDFRRQFQIISDHNGWETTVKAACLTSSLRGAALTVLSTLSDFDMKDYDKICTALNRRYGDEHLSKLFYTQLENRRQSRTEDLASLGHDIERLMRNALPDCPSKTWEQIACTKFISAISDPNLKQALRLAAPTTLHQAIIKGLEIEAINKEELGSSRIRQIEKVETDRPVLEAKRTFPVMGNGNSNTQNAFFTSSNSHFVNKKNFIRECFYCRKKGHVVENCFALQRRFQEKMNNNNQNSNGFSNLNQSWRKDNWPQKTNNNQNNVNSQTADSNSAYRPSSNSMGIQNKPSTSSACNTGNSQVVIRRCTRSGLYARGTVNGVQCLWVIDTGAEVSIVRSDLLQCFPLTSSSTSALRTATGQTTPVLGKVVADIDVEGYLNSSHEFLVADIEDEGILGMDFLLAHNCTLAVTEHTLRSGIITITLLTSKPLTSSNPIDQESTSRLREVTRCPETRDGHIDRSFELTPQKLESLVAEITRKVSNDLLAKIARGDISLNDRCEKRTQNVTPRSAVRGPVNSSSNPLLSNNETSIPRSQCIFEPFSRTPTNVVHKTNSLNIPCENTRSGDSLVIGSFSHLESYRDFSQETTNMRENNKKQSHNWKKVQNRRITDTQFSTGEDCVEADVCGGFCELGIGAYQ